MADSDSTSGTVLKKRKVTKKGKGRAKPSVSSDKDEQLTCQICTDVFTDPKDQLMECERCENWFCTKCLKISDEVYRVMTDRKDLHWFCSECEKPAISAVKTDKEIEEKCAAYMSSINDKIDNIEEKLSGKADKSTIDELDARIKCLEGKGTEKQSETQNDTVRVTIEEQRERESRMRNLIFQNLPESKEPELDDRTKEDKDTIEKIVSAIGVEEEIVIERCVRLGKRETGKTRITKVTVESAEVKKKILKKSNALKENKDYDNVYIGPDLTKMQRTEQFNLRKELRERKEKGETDIFISRGKIIRAKEKAVQFRGGASGSEKKD